MKWWSRMGLEDPRWLGNAEPDEWDALFGDRQWLTNRIWPAPVRSDGSSHPGLVTADLVYFDPDPRYRETPPFHHFPPMAHLAAAKSPTNESAETVSRRVSVPAGTAVQILGYCIYIDDRFYEDVLYTWQVGEQFLWSDPAERGSVTQTIANALVTALVAPTTSPLASVEAGSLLVERAYKMASDAWANLPPAREWVPPLPRDALP